MLNRYHYRRCVAYHEAGHALVARVLETRVKRILIGKRVGLADGIDGLVSLGPAPGGAIDEVTISLAGKVAEHRAGYRSSGVAESTDLKQARCKLGAHVALEPVITRRAEAIVNRHWYDIQSLAAVLQRRRCLEEDDFNQLMYERRLGPPPPLDLDALPADADVETQVLHHSLIYPEYPSPPSPDRVTLPDDADTETRLLICSLIYPEPRNPVSAEWVQLTVEDLCPKLTAAEAAALLRYIADNLKATLADSYPLARGNIIREAALIESLAVAADRYHTRALAASAAMAAARIPIPPARRRRAATRVAG